MFVIYVAQRIFHINFHKLSRQNSRCRHLPACRYIAVGQFGTNLLAFSI
jgi:hypothetical protein